MDAVCTLCRRTAARQDCYVRLETEDRPACRACWEQLFLDPRRILRSLQAPQTDRFAPDRPFNN